METQLFERTLLKNIPRFAVLLHNDDVHSMDYVVESLMKSVPKLTQDAAIDVMRETHEKGRGVVTVCPLEQAELFRDRIRSFALGCTVEPA